MWCHFDLFVHFLGFYNDLAYSQQSQLWEVQVGMILGNDENKSSMCTDRKINRTHAKLFHTKSEALKKFPAKMHAKSY